MAQDDVKKTIPRCLLLGGMGDAEHTTKQRLQTFFAAFCLKFDIF